MQHRLADHSKLYAFEGGRLPFSTERGSRQSTSSPIGATGSLAVLDFEIASGRPLDARSDAVLSVQALRLYRRDPCRCKVTRCQLIRSSVRSCVTRRRRLGEKTPQRRTTIGSPSRTRVRRTTPCFARDGRDSSGPPISVSVS